MEPMSSNWPRLLDLYFLKPIAITRQAGMRKLALMFAARMEQKSSPVDGTGDEQRVNVDGIIHLPV